MYVSNFLKKTWDQAIGGNKHDTAYCTYNIFQIFIFRHHTQVVNLVFVIE